MDESRRSLLVPVRHCAAGAVTPMLARLPEGTRTGLAFTTSTALTEACHPGQPWIHLTETALRALLTPLGITQVQLDPPDLTHPAARAVPTS